MTADAPTGRRSRRGQIAGTIVGLALVLALYAWTAATSAGTFPTELSLKGRDYYNHLTDAFLHGQIALRVEPPAKLLALEDPYDQAQYSAVKPLPPHDMSLFEGRYYVYWGPTPALTLFLPARLLLFGHDLSERAAIVIFSFAGLLVSLALLRYAARRFLPYTRRWMLAMGGLALATGTTALYNLRRPTIYEVALSAGFCFTMAGAYLLLRGALEERHRWRRLAGASACLGLAAGARPTLALNGLLAVAVLVFLLRSGALPSRATRWRAVLALLGPLSVAGLLMLAYNAARFGSPSQFGLIYQLNQFDPFPPDGGIPHFVPGLFMYLLAPPLLNLNFPFVHLPPPPDYPGTLPPGYNLEHVGGLLPMVPIVLLALVALPVALRSAAPTLRGLGAVMATGLVAGGLVLLAISASIYAGTMRYGMDFVPLILVSALLGWMLLASMPRRRLRRAFAIGGAAAIAWTAVAGVATSITGQWDSLRLAHPQTYASLERALSPLPTAAVTLAGRPLITEVSAPREDRTEADARSVADTVDVPGAADVRVRYGQAGAGRIRSMEVGRETAILEIVSPRRRLAVIRSVVERNAGLGTAPSRLTVRSRERPEKTVTIDRPSGPVDASVALDRGLNHIELQVIDPPPAGRPLRGPPYILREVRLVTG